MCYKNELPNSVSFRVNTRHASLSNIDRLAPLPCLSVRGLRTEGVLDVVHAHINTVLVVESVIQTREQSLDEHTTTDPSQRKAGSLWGGVGAKKRGGWVATCVQKAPVRIERTTSPYAEDSSTTELSGR